MGQNPTSLSALFSTYRFRMLGTWLLVLAESALMLLIPLVMGIAIDDLLLQKTGGLYWLGGIGMFIIAVGSARRFYDTRVYSHIYALVARQVVMRERSRDSDVSAITARTNMVSELVEFLENSFPAMINCVIGLVGTLLIVWMLQLGVFIGCVVAAGLIALLFALTSGKTYSLNKGFNDESERRVSALSSNDPAEAARHFQRSIRWNIRLSDLETVNFAVSWLIMIAVLLLAVWLTVHDTSISRGKILSILMYVFEFIECVIAIPLFYQQFVRLQEITHRLEELTPSDKQ